MFWDAFFDGLSESSGANAGQVKVSTKRERSDRECHAMGTSFSVTHPPPPHPPPLPLLSTLTFPS
jgi:hypothetical protein